MIFPAIESLDDADLARGHLGAGLDRRIAANIAHIIRVDWIDCPWPMTRDQWADWWRDGLRHQAHLLPAMTEAQLDALTEAYAYVVESQVPRDQAAATICALLAKVGFASVAEHVSSPFAASSEPRASGARQQELLAVVTHAPGLDPNELMRELMAQHPHGQKKGGELRRTYRRALANMLQAGALIERNGKVHPPGEDFSDLLGAP